MGVYFLIVCFLLLFQWMSQFIANEGQQKKAERKGAMEARNKRNKKAKADPKDAKDEKPEIFTSERTTKKAGRGRQAVSASEPAQEVVQPLAGPSSRRRIGPKVFKPADSVARFTKLLKKNL